MSQNLEEFWDKILSRDPKIVAAAYFALDNDTQISVRYHLQKMCADAGWQEEQRISASAALEALGLNIPRSPRKRRFRW